ncbi:hypothetical protein ACX1C1_03950 [Paenibacillus sp. strain BS8-2]
MISKKKARELARANWRQWRLLLSDMNITYSDIMQMDDDDLAEANAALDLYIEAQERKNKNQSK